MYENNLIGSTYMKYKFIKLLGRGGMDSEVYLAEYIGDDNTNSKYKYAAIKIIYKTSETTSDHWNKILDEAVTNARLSKRSDVNIVKLFNYDTTNANVVKTIMEYMDGPSLKILLRERGTLSVAETLYFFKKILIGVQYMHNQDRSIIHRDLKPENILTSSDLIEAKISDFGVCTVIAQTDDKRNVLTNEFSFFGTVPYVTPDAFTHGYKKSAIITKQYDFHSLGVILYELLIGDKPFEIADENDVNTISYYLKYDVTPMKYINPSIRNELENIFLRLTASKQDDIHLRYKDVSEILNDVRMLEKSIAENLPEQESLKPYEKRVFQNIVPLALKENYTLFKSVIKNKVALGCVITFLATAFFFILFCLLGFLW